MDSPQGVTPRTLEPFFEFMSNFMIFEWHFEILYQGDPLETLKTNYMAYINNFQTERPILDFRVSLDRTNQDTNLCLRG